MRVAATLPLRWIGRGSITCCCLLLLACSAKLTHVHLSELQQRYPAIKNIDGVPFFPQETHQCGPAALAMLLSWSELHLQPQQLIEPVFLPGRSGSIQAEMLAGARRHGRLAYPLQGGLDSLAAELQAGHPVLVLQNLGLDWLPRWHYAVVTGLDLNQQTVRLHSGITKDYELGLATFVHTWQRAANWAAVILKPGKLPASAEPHRYLRAVLDMQNSLNHSVMPESALPDRIDLIETAYLQGISHWPEQPLLRMGLANWYNREQQAEKALHVLTALLQRYPDYAPAHNNMALLLLGQNRLTLALQHAKTAVALGGQHKPEYLDTLTEVRLAIR